MRKRRGSRGFSLAETLLAILILLMVSAIVATGIPSAKNAYEKVILGSNAQLLLSTTVTALRNELGTARDLKKEKVKVGGKEYDAITYVSAGTGAKTAIYLDKRSDTNNDQMIRILEYVADADNTADNSRFLVSDAASTNSMYATFDLEQSTIDSENNTVTLVGLTVYRTKTTGNALAQLYKEGGSDLVIHMITTKSAA